MSGTTLRAGDPLSEREVEILKLVADGLSNAQIGTRLYLSPATVKAHLHRMGGKLGCGDRAGMVAIGFRTGLLHVPRGEGVSLPGDLGEEMLSLARMIVEERPLGAARASARRVLAWSRQRVSP